MAKNYKKCLILGLSRALRESVENIIYGYLKEIGIPSQVSIGKSDKIVKIDEFKLKTPAITFFEVFSFLTTDISIKVFFKYERSPTRSVTVRQIPKLSKFALCKRFSLTEWRVISLIICITLGVAELGVMSVACQLIVIKAEQKKMIDVDTKVAQKSRCARYYSTPGAYLKITQSLLS